MTGRGCLTDKIQQVAKKELGNEITQKQLRLMAYLQYTAMNSQKLDRLKMDREESDIIAKWEEEGYLTRDFQAELTLTKKFWDAMNQILWLAYVVCD